MKPGEIVVPVTVKVDFTGDGAEFGRLMNRCLAAEALAESRKQRVVALELELAAYKGARP